MGISAFAETGVKLLFIFLHIMLCVLISQSRVLGDVVVQFSVLLLN